MAKNVQLYDYTGTTKLYPTTVAQEVIYNDDPLSDFLSDCVSVDNDHEQRIYALEQNAVVADGSITTEKIANGAVTHYKLAEESVYPSHIVDEAITAMKIADDAVGTYKIQDGAVTMDKLSDDVKTILENAEVEDGSITTAKLANDAVTKDKIADDAVTSSQIKDGEILWGKLSIPVQMRIEAAEAGASGNSSTLSSLADRIEDAETFIKAVGFPTGSYPKEFVNAEKVLYDSYVSPAIMSTPLNGFLDTLRAKDKEIDTALEDIRQDVESNSSDISSLKGRVTETEKDIITNTSDISALGVRVTKNEGDIITNTTDISNLTNSVNSEIASIKSVNTTQTNQISTLDTKVQTLETKTDSLENTIEENIASLSSAISENKEYIDFIKVPEEYHWALFGDEKKYIDFKKLVYVTVENETTTSVIYPHIKLELHEEKIESLESTSETLNQAVSDLSNRIDTNANNITGLDNRLGTAESNITTNANNIAGLDNRVTTIENTAPKIISLTQAEYNNLDEYKFNVIYYITDGTSTLSNLLNRVTALENKTS